jgi:polysaccharide pyruvyl transferase WcaK-like protein
MKNLTPKNRQKITLTGFYGMMNFGDDLFAYLGKMASEKWWGNQSIEVLAPKENEGSLLHKIIPKSIRSQYSRTDKVGKTIRLGYAASTLINSDRIVFCGGSLFSSDRSRSIEILSSLPLLKNKNLSAIGISIGPFNTQKSEHETLQFLKRFDYISTRDKKSFDFLEAHKINSKIVRSKDIVGVIRLIENHEKFEKAGGFIGYSSCHTPANPNLPLEFENQFIQFAQSRRDLCTKVLNLNSHPELGDANLNKRAYDRLIALGLHAEFVDYQTMGMKITLREIESCALVASIRLHGAISAYMLDTPFVLCEYHPKCTHFLDEVGQPDSLRLGLWGNSTQGRGKTKKLSECLESFFSHRENPTVSQGDFAALAKLSFTEAPWASKRAS